MSSTLGTSAPDTASVQAKRGRAPAASRAVAGTPRRGIVGLALALALVFSTQFFAQDFVWRHWERSEVLWAGVGILAERAAVGLAVAAAVLLALRGFERRPSLPRAARTVLYTAAVVAAVVAAELIGAPSGMGYAIEWYRQLLMSPKVFGFIAVIGVVGFLSDLALRRLQRVLTPWAEGSEL